MTKDKRVSVPAGLCSERTVALGAVTLSLGGGEGRGAWTSRTGGRRVLSFLLCPVAVTESLRVPRSFPQELSARRGNGTAANNGPLEELSGCGVAEGSIEEGNALARALQGL